MNQKDVSRYYTDENVTRLIALQVVIVILLILYGSQSYLIIFLTIDFALRAFTYLSSPTAFLAKGISKALKLKSKPVFANPKKFASGVGFVFSLVISILLYLNHFNIAFIVGNILILFATLESVFKICAGCYVYNWIVLPIENKRNNKTKN